MTYRMTGVLPFYPRFSIDETPIFDTSVDFLAVDVFNRLLSSDDAVMRLSDAFMAVAKYDAALSILRKVGDSSRDATFYQKQGYCCVNCHEYESAIESFNNAHGLNPKNKWTLRQLALCYRAVGKPSEAARCYAKLSELMPENAKIARRLAECQEECSDYSEAAKALYKVIFYDEGSAEARVALSRCLLRLGDVGGQGRELFVRGRAADIREAEAVAPFDELDAGRCERADGRDGAHVKSALP